MGSNKRAQPSKLNSWSQPIRRTTSAKHSSKVTAWNTYIKLQQHIYNIDVTFFDIKQIYLQVHGRYWVIDIGSSVVGCDGKCLLVSGFVYSLNVMWQRISVQNNCFRSRIGRMFLRPYRIFFQLMYISAWSWSRTLHGYWFLLLFPRALDVDWWRHNRCPSVAFVLNLNGWRGQNLSLGTLAVSFAQRLRRLS